MRNRYFYLMLRFLSSTHRPIRVISPTFLAIDPRVYLRSDPYARLAYVHPHCDFGTEVPRDVSDKILICDDESDQLIERNWQKIIHIEYDFSRVAPASTYQVMPFPMHPLQYAQGLDARFGEMRGRRRKVRFFFAGNTDPTLYAGSPAMQSAFKQFGILPRIDVLSIVRMALRERIREVSGDLDMATIKRGAEQLECVIVRQDARVPWPSWLEALSLCDIALCPSGADMPYCHNLIEAMSVGAIPFTDYPGWLSPPLIDGENCIAFRGRDDLVSRARMVLDLPHSEIERMKRNVQTYYDTFLAPEAFSERLLAHPARDLTLFVLTDDPRIMARVHPQSVVFADSSLSMTT